MNAQIAAAANRHRFVLVASYTNRFGPVEIFKRGLTEITAAYNHDGSFRRGSHSTDEAADEFPKTTDLRTFRTWFARSV